MTPLPAGATDAEILSFLDRWAALLEQGDYDAAFAHTDHVPGLGWTPALIHETISWFGPFDPDRRVTVECGPTTVTERRVVTRWPEPRPDGFFGDVWYGLNINGEATDLVATFALQSSADGVTVHLQDVNVP